MNKIKNNIFIIILFLFIYLLFKYNKIVNNSVIYSVELWLTKVFPSLFIMFIINDIIINTNILNYISKLFDPFFSKFFKVSNNSFEVFILSIFSGTPSSAIIIKEMLYNNKLDINSSNKLISYTLFSNPLFLYNILSQTFSKYITIKIIIINYVSNIIVGLILRGKKNNNILVKNYYTKKNIFEIIPYSIKKNMEIMIMILGTITFYMIICNILIEPININIYGETIIKGIFEITQGLNILNQINSISIIKEIIAISIISFGGLSIHTQVLSIIKDTNIKYSNFILGRLLHIIVSTLTYIICSISFTS